MRRQFSARLKKALLDSNNHVGLRKNNVLRFSSTDFLSRTRPRNSVDRRQYHRQHGLRHQQRQRRQQQRLPHNCYRTYSIKKTNCYFFRRDITSFHDLRACYFSNAVERSHEVDVKVNDSVSIDTRNTNNRISTQLAQLFVEEEDSDKLNYVKTLKSWYLDNHGESGSVVQDAFCTKMIQNPNSRQALSSVQGVENDDKSGDVAVVVDGTIRQIFTATFTCPLTNEQFEAGRLTGYYDIEDRNFYSRKKVAIQAVSAVVLSHKMNTSEGEMFCDGDGHGLVESDSNIDTKYSIQLNDDQSTFRQILQRLYMKHYKVSPNQSQSTIIKQDFVGKTRGGTWWTAEFTCPITGRKYEAIDLPSDFVSDSMKMKEAGKIWYRKKTDSVHASASNAIESVDWNAELHVFEDQNSESDLKDSQKSADDDKDLKELLSPLSSWYTEHEHGDLKISIEDNFVVTGGSGFRDGDGGNKLWTASFLCPLTGERLDSGTINATDALSSTEIDKLIWYTEKNAAIQAASQRAYDVFKYRDTGVKDPRFCKEDPSEHTIEAFDLSLSIHGEMNTSNLGVQEMNDNELTKQSDFAFEHDEDDFVIEVIPQQIIQSSGSHGGSSKTLDVIAKAWIDSTGVSPDIGNSEQRIENFQNAFSEREKAICRALEWVSRQDQKNVKLSKDRTQFDMKGQMCHLKIANAILSSLAECHQRVPFDSQLTGVEECAAAILESMWSSHSTKPDANSYALYLKCLEGKTPSAVTAKAQKIVDAMESGHDYNQRSLPEPNDAIYCSLTEISASSGLKSIIESSGFNSLDRTTHLCKLSAMAHDLSTFDIDMATKLIDQMRISSKRNDKPSLQPDNEVYNAPLRWSGGHLWSRLYSRVIPWDSYNEIYKDGFKSDDEIDVQQKYAEKVEEWIEIMKRKALNDDALAPNIETYESLIQAWVRCGNQENLLRAETIAKSIIAGEYSGIQPRTQTFYPILAAWTYSGCEEGPQKVESWIDLLQEQVPKLEANLAFPNVSVMAQISLQGQILDHLSNSLDEETSSMENCIFDSAIKCSKFLDNRIDEYKSSPDFQVQSCVFVLVINAWHNAASAAMLQDNLEKAKKCLREIQNIVDQFDDLLVWLYQVDDGDTTRTQFLRLLNLAPSIYGAQLAALSTTERNLGEFRNVASKDYDKTMHLISIEEKIRRLEEFNPFWEDDGSSVGDGMLKGKIGIDAMSIFPREGFIGGVFCTSWPDYIDSSLNILEKGANDSSIGESDFVRLCMLIARVTSSATPTVLNSIEKDRIIEKVVNILKSYCGNNQDKETVLSTVIQSLNKHSVRPGSKKIRTHSTASKYDANDEFHQEKGQESGITDLNAKKKMRRERAHRNDLHRNAYSRSKALNRSLRRRPRPRNIK